MEVKVTLFNEKSALRYCGAVMVSASSHAEFSDDNGKPTEFYRNRVTGAPDFGGGGLFIDRAYVWMEDALITENYAADGGGGLSTCTTGTAEVGSLHGAMIFNNRVAEDSEYDPEIKKYKDVLFHSNDHHDYLREELIEGRDGFQTAGMKYALYESMFNGGLHQWSGKIVTKEATLKWNGNKKVLLHSYIAQSNPTSTDETGAKVIFKYNEVSADKAHGDYAGNVSGGGIADNGLLEIGTKKNNKVTTEIKIVKVWKDENYLKKNLRPTTDEFLKHITLYKDSVPLERSLSELIKNGDSIKVSVFTGEEAKKIEPYSNVVLEDNEKLRSIYENGQWELDDETYWVLVVSGLESGYEYYIEENPVTGYTLDEQNSRGMVLFNTLDTTDIKVEKIWKDDTLTDRPPEIKVVLLNGEEKIDWCELKAAENWKHTFENLPVYVDGKKADYSIKEEFNSPEYHTDIEEMSDGSFQIINRKLSKIVPEIFIDVRKYLNGHRAAGFTFGLYEEGAPQPLAYSTTNSNGHLTLEANIQFTKAGTYLYIIKEFNESNPAVEYDKHPVDLYIDVEKVEKDGEYVLGYTTRYVKNGKQAERAEFENKFHVTGTASIKASKYITGRSWLDGESFTFTLTPVGDAPLRTADGKQSALTAVAKYDGIHNEAVFDELLFTEEDLLDGDYYRQDREYSYRIVENADDIQNGLKYDETPKLVTIHLHNTRNSKELQITYGEEKSETLTNPVFVNVYQAEPVSVNLKAVKQIVDHKGEILESWKDTDDDWTYLAFQFELIPETANAPMPEVTKASATYDNRTVHFDNIVFTHPGKYYYQIRELVPEGEDKNDPVHNDLFYDLAPAQVEVDVTDNHMGYLTAKVYYNGAETDGLTFTNREVPGAYITIRALKEIIGAPYVPSEFVFQLNEKHETGETIFGRNHTGTNGEDGIVEFTALTYEHDDLCNEHDTVPKTIHYVMEEVNHGDAGWQYDRQRIEFRVTVEHSEDHKISVTSVMYSSDAGQTWKSYDPDDADTYPVFTNIYNTLGTAQLFADKHISGREWTADDSFEFVLTGEDGAPIHIRKDELQKTEDSLLAHATWDNKTALFDPMYFTMEDLKNPDGTYDTAKTYTYRIHESGAGEATDGTFTRNGITYAPDQIVKVNLENDLLTGELHVTYQEGTDTLHLDPFINHYAVTDQKRVTVGANKNIENRAWKEGDKFTFRIYPVLNDAGYEINEMPLPANEMMTISYAADNVSGQKNTKAGWFEDIVFERAGTYEYEIEEVIPDNPVAGMFYTQDKHSVVIMVNDAVDGTLSEPEIYYSGTGGSVPTTFVNTWNEIPPEKNEYYFSFTKKWSGDVKNIEVRLYHPDGRPYNHALRPRKTNDSEYVYEAWLSSPGDYYAIETPLSGYVQTYLNYGDHADATDRVYNKGVIINTFIPNTGETSKTLLWACLGLASLAGLLAALMMLKMKKH